nr:MAG TPA: hypothetical protein [Caudoviricetes sp.]
MFWRSKQVPTGIKVEIPVTGAAPTFALRMPVVQISKLTLLDRMALTALRSRLAAIASWRRLLWR